MVEKEEMKTYEIIYEDGKPYAIRCCICNMTSYNENDIEQKYCGNCHQFHNILEFLRDNEKR